MLDPTGPLLIDTGDICYLTPATGELTWRPCRTWVTDTGCALSVVTEPPDAPGMSITNAAENVFQVLKRARPNYQVRVFEHYPAHASRPEHYDEQIPTAQGMTWKNIPIHAMHDLIGPDLHATNPLLR